MTYSDTDGTIRKRSGWLIPLGVFLVTAALSALVLLFYLAPTAPNFLEEQVSPTSRGDIIALKVHGLQLWIPANYLQYESARQGGTRKDLAAVRDPARHERLVELGSLDLHQQHAGLASRLSFDP